MAKKKCIRFTREAFREIAAFEVLVGTGGVPAEQGVPEEAD